MAKAEVDNLLTGPPSMTLTGDQVEWIFHNKKMEYLEKETNTSIFVRGSKRDSQRDVVITGSPKDVMKAKLGI